MELNECFRQHLLKRANSGGERGMGDGGRRNLGKAYCVSENW